MNVNTANYTYFLEESHDEFDVGLAIEPDLGLAWDFEGTGIQRIGKGYFTSFFSDSVT
jgi:hypothetical protein